MNDFKKYGEKSHAKDDVLFEQHCIGCSAASRRDGERIGPNQG